MTTVIIRRKQAAATLEGWRCLHKNEAPGSYNETPPGMPEVRPSANARPIEMTEVIQWILYTVMSANPVITPARYRNILRFDKALTNENGYDDDGDPRADFINNRDTTQDPPKLMKAILFGGMYIPNHIGTVVGSDIICRPGIHGLDANALPKTWRDFQGADEDTKRTNMMQFVKARAEEVFAKRWYFEAVDWFPNPDRVSRFTQGWNGADYYGPVYIAYILRDPTPYPKAWFREWIGREYPDPLKYYG